MKKSHIAAIIFIALAAGILGIKLAIAAPAKATAYNLAAINGLVVGKTTEIELLTRREFQTLERKCIKESCFYDMETDNTFLNRLHLAPRTNISTYVWVRDGLVTKISIFVTKTGLERIEIQQVSKLPPGCSSNPCAEQMTIPRKNLLGASIVFNSESDIRNHMQDAINSACLSRLHGCDTYAELMPITKSLNLNSVHQ